MDERQIGSWVDRGLIEPAQGEALREDLATGGSVPRWADTLLLFVAALATGAALFGFATVNGLAVASHTLAMLWLICMLPVVYVARNGAVSALANALFFAWVALYALRDMNPVEVYDRARFLPVLFLTGGLFLFQLGGAHDAVGSLRRVARTFRLGGLGVGLLGLYALTFEAFGANAMGGTHIRSVEASGRFVGALLTMCAVGAGLAVLNQIVRARLDTAVTRTEAPISLGLFALIAAYTALPVPSVATVAAFNVAAVVLCGTVITVSIQRGDRLVFDIAVGALLLVIAGRYVDFVWGATDPTTFGLGLATVAIVGVVSWVGVRRRVMPRRQKEA